MSEDWENTRRLLEELEGVEDAQRAVRELDLSTNDQTQEHWEKLAEKTLIERSENGNGASEQGAYEFSQLNEVKSLSNSFSPERTYPPVGDNFSRFYTRLKDQDIRNSLLASKKDVFMDENAFNIIMGNEQFEFEVRIPLGEMSGVALLGYLESNFSDYEFQGVDFSEGYTEWEVSFGRNEVLRVFEEAEKHGKKVYYADTLPDRDKNEKLEERLKNKGYPEGQVEGVLHKIQSMDCAEPSRVEKDPRSTYQEDGGIALKARAGGLDVVTTDTDFLEKYDVINKKSVNVYTPHQALELKRWSNGN